MEPSTYEGHRSHVPQRKGVRENRSSAEGPWKDCPGVYLPLCVHFPPPTPPVTNLLGCPSPPCALQHGPCTDRAVTTQFALLAASLIMPHLLPRSSCITCCLAHRASPAASLIMPHLLPRSSCLNCCLAHPALPAASLIMPHLLPRSSCLTCFLTHHALLAASFIMPHLLPRSSCLTLSNTEYLDAGPLSDRWLYTTSRTTRRPSRLMAWEEIKGYAMTQDYTHETN